MADVFISYHEKSAGDIAAKIAAALEEAGISCWYAKRDIPPGGDFARYIPPQIDACRVFLLILNDSAVYRSRHIENELGLAFGRFNHGEKITIFPLEIGNFKRETWIRYYLVHTQSVKIPFADTQNIRELAQRIANALGYRPAKVSDKKQYPTPQTEQSSPVPSRILRQRIERRRLLEEAEARAAEIALRQPYQIAVIVRTDGVIEEVPKGTPGSIMIDMPEPFVNENGEIIMPTIEDAIDRARRSRFNNS